MPCGWINYIPSLIMIMNLKTMHQEIQREGHNLSISLYTFVDMELWVLKFIIQFLGDLDFLGFNLKLEFLDFI